MGQKAEIASHEVNRTVGNILDILQSERIAEKTKNVSPTKRLGLRRIEIFCRQLREQLETNSDFDVSTNGLDTIQSNLSNTWSEINSFISNGQESHIVNALSNLDGALVAAAWTFFKRPQRGSRVYGETIASIEQQSNDAIERILTKIRQAEERLEQLQSESSAHITRINEASETIEGYRNNISDEIANIQHRMNENFVSEEAKIDQEIRQFREDVSKFLADRSEDARKFVETLSSHELQARQILNIIGNIGVTGNYQARSLAEETQANTWRWITIGLFGLGIFIIIVNIILNFADKVSLDLLLARFAIGISIALPAIYTARESARHRSNADRAKQTELELASLGPFLQKLGRKLINWLARTASD